MPKVKDKKSNNHKKKSKAEAGNKKLRFYETWAFIIFFCLILPMSFRSLFYAPFHIPSGSMKPTLLIGDFIFVAKGAYGYSRYSFPLGIDLFSGRINAKQPKRGDIIVFRPPPTPGTDFIKRLIGLPGDSIQIIEGELYINNKKVERKRIEDFVEDEPNGSVQRYKQYIETLPNGVSYRVLDDISDNPLDNTPAFFVPNRHYFFMGDNRDHSADSRTTTVGLVPEQNLIGRTEIIFFSVSDSLWKFWNWFSTMRGERFWIKPDAGIK